MIDLKGMFPAIFHLSDGYWDCALPRYLLQEATNGLLIPFVGIAYSQKLKAPCGVIVVPGRHSTNDYDALNEASRSFEKCIWMITGDEEGILRSERLQHPNQRIWWFLPPFAPKQNINVAVVNGWPSDCLEMLKEIGPRRRDFDWSFAGQITHSRRLMCIDALQGIERPGFLLPTDGFTKGLPRHDYYANLLRTKMVLCPSGPCTPDTFRFAEALEAGCIPVADNLIQHDWYPEGYWRFVLGEELPFPVISSWDTLPEVLEEWLTDWDLKTERCQRWWQAKKNSWILQLRSDISA